MFPKSFYSGDRVSVTARYSEYKPTDYDLSVAIRGPSLLDLEATASGDSFAVNITPTQSGLLVPGQYFYQAIADDGDGDRVTVESGSFTVLPNLAEINGVYDGRSQLEKDLELVNSAIRALTTDNVKEYRIKEREVTKQDLPELIKWRDKLKVELSREKAKQSGISKSLQVRFT